MSETTMTTAASRPEERSVLSRGTIITHGAIGMPISMLGYPLAIWIPAYYSSELGVSIAVVGFWIMIGRFTDVFTDPLVGIWSDHARTRWGRRKPFIVAGVPVLVLGVAMLFWPSYIWGDGQMSSIYLFIWISVVWLGWTLIYIPYTAWGAELSPDYNERSRVAAWREVYYLVGLFVAAAVPTVVELFINPGEGRLRLIAFWMGMVVVIAMPLAAALVVSRVAEPPATPRSTIPLARGLLMIAENRPMVIVMVILLIAYGGEAFRNALSVFFMGDVIGVQNRGAVYLGYFVVGISGIPVWLALGKRLGKHKALGICLTGVAGVSTANFFLQFGDVTPFVMLFLLKGFCFGGLLMLPLAMVADVIDEDQVRTRENRAGTFFALTGLLRKLSYALGSGGALMAVGMLGYDPSLGIGNNTSQALFWVQFNYTLAPAFFFFIAVILLWFYPLTQERQEELRALIERHREERQRQTP